MEGEEMIKILAILAWFALLIGYIMYFSEISFIMHIVAILTLLGWGMVLFGFGLGVSDESGNTNMNYITALDNQIVDVLWELKGETSQRGTVSKPGMERRKYLEGQLAILETARTLFWETHKYETPNGGRIVEK